MSEPPLTTDDAPAPPATSRPALLLALALLSGAGLLLEISLTRLLSTLYYPPTVFAVISLALLGLGLGAALVTARASWRRSHHAPTFAALSALSALLLAAFAVYTAPFSILALLLLLVIVPFLFIGMTFAVLFAQHSAASPRLYLADLAGAGLGALLAVPLLDWVGGVNGVIVSGIGLGVAAWGLAIVKVRRERFSAGGRAEALTTSLQRLPALVALVGVLVLAGNLWTAFLTIDMGQLSSEKPIVESLAGEGETVATRWDAFARSDLVAPGDGGPYRLYIDGAAGSVMPPAANDDFLWQDIGLFPFATEQPPRVFVIGPGGGLDVWFGLQSGAEEIVAVEVNEASTELVREFSQYNGDLYGQPGVRVVSDEGRSVLRREGQAYDLIFLSQVVTLAAERSGYALVEESAFTLEAFDDYLQHLAPDGMLALKLYDEPTLTRALATALAALQNTGRGQETGPSEVESPSSDQEALTHVMAFLDPSGDPPVPLLMVRNIPFSRDDSLSLAAVAQQVGFRPLFLPHVLAEPPLQAVAAGEASLDEVIANADIDVTPTSDDRPFFYQFERGLPASLQPLLAGLGALVLAGGGLLVVTQRRLAPGFARRAPLYFAALGLGFIMLEIAIIQQTRLFLGHPTLAITTVLATLLVGGGLGSGLAGRLVPPSERPPAWPALAVVLLALAWLLLWPLVGDAFLAATQSVRVVIVILTLLPLALVMGMPFPLGLRAAGLSGRRHVALAWAVNGIMSVVGSATAIATAMLWGFSTVLAIAIGAYVVAAIVVELHRMSTN